MELKKEKLVRFCNDGKLYPENSWENKENTTNTNTNNRRHEKRLPLHKAASAAPPLLKPDGTGNGVGGVKISSWKRNIIIIIDPGSEISLMWNRIFLFSCLMALFVDPLFFYLPSVFITDNSSCMSTDLNLGITVTCLRTFADLFYLLHVIIKFRTAYVSPQTRVFGRGELVMDPKKIADRYLKSDFFIDAIAMLPLPQIVIWFILPAIRSSHADHTNNTIVLIVFLQYIPRLYLIFPLSSQIIKSAGLVTKTAWAGAVYNLLLYMLASHILGASWYLLSMERHATCWKSVCKQELDPVKCNLRFLDCGSLNHQDRMIWANNTGVFTKCDPDNSSDIGFKYGIFGDLVTKNVETSKFLEKYFYCLWWGLQNLSSYGQNLSTSTFIGETLFAILIAILGLVLFAHLIGNMQTYLQSMTVRLEEWRLKRRDTEKWMRHRQLPRDLQERVRRFIQYKWLATRGVDEESILHSLPTDLRRDIQRHLCLDLVRRVPFFSEMDDQLLDAICERLSSSLSTQGTYIVREDDPVTAMQFIIRGKLESSTTNGGRTGFFNSITLSPGDFCGEELLSWALHPKSSLNLPSSTRTVKALVEVESFALRAEDLKFVANQFRRLHSKKLQHTFRFYSHHWRTWGTCFIQAAWRRYKRRMMAKALSMKLESFSYDNTPEKEMTMKNTEEEEETKNKATKQSLGVTILASRFAANTRRRGALKIKQVGLMNLQKPEEPDFSAEPDEDV